MADTPYNPETDGPLVGEEYDPASHGAIVPAAPKSVDAYRVAGQVGTGANDALYNGVMALPDLSARLTRYLGLTSPNTPLPSEAFRNWAARNGNERPAEWAPQNSAENVGRAVGGGIGDAINFMVPFSAVSRVAALPSVVRNASAAMAAQPVTQALASGAGAGVTEATGNPYLGAATSLALPAAVGGAQRVFSAAPAANTQEAERRALLEFGRKNDLGPLTAGKITDSGKLQTYEGAINRAPIPYLGGRVKATEEAGRDAWQKAILGKAGIYGETAATPEVIDTAKARIGRVFNGLENGTTVNIDPQFGADIAKAKASFSQQLRSQMPQDILSKLDELDGAASTLKQPGVTGVTIDGSTYKNIRSKLSAQLSSASGTDKQALGGMIDALDAAVGRSVPADMAKDWKTARSQWRNLMAIDNAVSGSNNAQTAVGNIPVARFGRESQGNPDLERYGQYGNKFVGEKMPYDTASRHAAGGGIGHLITGALGGLTGAAGAHGHVPINAYTIAGGAAAATPFAVDLGMNNPVARMLLLSRYRHPSQSIIPPGVYGSLASQAAINQQSK